MGVQEITAVPQTPQHAKRVINLRGKVVPVVDLRSKFGLPEVKRTARTCIVVLQTGTTRGALQMEVIVDDVSEVLSLAAGGC
jgi:purine-binding chemotaxis protein CheW